MGMTMAEKILASRSGADVVDARPVRVGRRRRHRHLRPAAAARSARHHQGLRQGQGVRRRRPLRPVADRRAGRRPQGAQGVRPPLRARELLRVRPPRHPPPGVPGARLRLAGRPDRQHRLALDELRLLQRPRHADHGGAAVRRDHRPDLAARAADDPLRPRRRAAAVVRRQGRDAQDHRRVRHRLRGATSRSSSWARSCRELSLGSRFTMSQHGRRDRRQVRHLRGRRRDDGVARRAHEAAGGAGLAGRRRRLRGRAHRRRHRPRADGRPAPRPVQHPPGVGRRRARPDDRPGVPRLVHERPRRGHRDGGQGPRRPLACTRTCG